MGGPATQVTLVVFSGRAVGLLTHEVVHGLLCGAEQARVTSLGEAKMTLRPDGALLVTHQNPQ